MISRPGYVISEVSEHRRSLLSLFRRHLIELNLAPNVRQLCPKRGYALRKVGSKTDHLKCPNWIGDPFHVYLPPLLAKDLLLHMSEGLVRNEHAARRRLVLEARSEIHGASDDRVIHSILAAEVADGAIAGVDTDPAAQRRFDAGVAPETLELADAPLHRERHRNTGKRVLLDATALGVAEEHHDGVTHVLVDRRAVLEGDFRHLGEVVVEELGEVLGFHLVGDFGETGDVGEADGQLLAIARDRDILVASEDGIVDLRREIFGELTRERLEGGGFFREALLPLLQLRDVGIHPDCAAIVSATLADHDPAAVSAPLHLRLAGKTVLTQALGQPFLDPSLSVLDVATLGGAPDDALEAHARHHVALVACIKELSVAGVAQD